MTKRYQRAIRICIYQTTQWPKDTKGEIRIYISDNTMTKRYQRGIQNPYIKQHIDQKIPKGNQNLYNIQHNDQKIPKGNRNLYIRKHNDQKIPKGKSESVYQTTQ